ncbi:unnamed protein product, partial [Amoebophrya sp. A120]
RRARARRTWPPPRKPIGAQARRRARAAIRLRHRPCRWPRLRRPLRRTAAARLSCKKLGEALLRKTTAKLAPALRLFSQRRPPNKTTGRTQFPCRARTAWGFSILLPVPATSRRTRVPKLFSRCKNHGTEEQKPLEEKVERPATPCRFSSKLCYWYYSWRRVFDNHFIFSQPQPFYNILIFFFFLAVRIRSGTGYSDLLKL